MSSLTCSPFTFFIISLIIPGNGPGIRAIASLSETALPTTLRLAPQDRQYCRPEDDSVPHCGQYMAVSVVSVKNLSCHVEKAVETTTVRPRLFNVLCSAHPCWR